MSLTILYRNPQRPDEGGMTMIAGKAEAGETINQLEKRGFVVIKISLSPLEKAVPRPVI